MIFEGWNPLWVTFWFLMAGTFGKIWIEAWKMPEFLDKKGKND